jgi:hypothetical protein
MKTAKFNNICSRIYDQIRARTPYASGNLHNNATKIERLGDAKIKIYVDESIAPYFKYVNNSPILSNSRANRNYQYFDNALVGILEELAKEEGATLIYD